MVGRSKVKMECIEIDPVQVVKNYPIQNDKFEIEYIDLSSECEKQYFESNKRYTAFEDSWFALLQGVRNNPRIYKRKLYFCGHPIKADTIVIYNHLAKNISELTSLINSLLADLSLTTAILKNVDINNMPLLKKYGFREYRVNEGFSESARFDDQTFPQYICSLKEISSLDGPCFAQIRQQVRVIEKKYTAELSYFDKIYKSGFIQLAQGIAMDIQQKQGGNLENILEANTIYLNFVPQNSYIIKIDGMPSSFIACDERDGTANFNCLIYNSKIKYLSTYTLVQASRTMYAKGIQWINLSGSECQSLNHWKKKFQPQKIIHRTHLIWEYKENYEAQN